MAQGIVRRIDGIGKRDVNAALDSLLSLTSDAMLVFDGSGRILVANDVANRLFTRSGSLAGLDVRALFSPRVVTLPDSPFSFSALPFATDGSPSTLTCTRANGTSVELSIRSERVGVAKETCILVAHELDASQFAQRERDRLVGELSRVNRRLSGTLNIVLDTLGTKDVSLLFEKVIEEITETMEASGTVFFVAEGDGYHLKGKSVSLANVKIPCFVASGRMIERLTTSAGHALRLRVLAPTRDALRQGRLTRREVLDEATHEIHRVRASTLPPFVSFIAVPVWFGGHVIALIEVGWDQVHPTRREDAELLDAVAQYLSVQLVGVFSTLRQRKASHLDNVASELRESLMETGGANRTQVASCLASACEELGASIHAIHAPILGSIIPTVELPGGEEPLTVSLGLSVPMQACGRDDITESGVRAIPDEDELAEWLEGLGAPSVGAVLDLGCLWGERCTYLVLREAGAEPLDEIELSFLRAVAHDIRELVLGDEARNQDKRIAQALQTGMRNELQSVEGISTQGIYSSATAAAVIGGDFYDLIRLPHKRACVIMGDVSGKGVEAASVSAAVRTALGAYSWQGLEPARMVRLLNDFLLGFSRLETFATLFVGIVDRQSSTLTYCSAGHPPSLLIRASGEVESLDVQSGVVGAFHEMRYRNGYVRLSEGDMLLLYTDGTTEARSPTGDFFGDEGLRDAIMMQAPRGFEGFLDRMLNVLDNFTERRLEDDVAMVLLRFDELDGGDEGEGPNVSND